MSFKYTGVFMNLNYNSLEINSFSLSSSSEVLELIQRIRKLEKRQMLIHIVSFMHNTVLVHSLKLELLKIFPHAKISLLKHQYKTKTSVVLYTLDKEINETDIRDEVLKELQLDNSLKATTIDLHRKQLLGRYFTDHLTNLPNMYQLRKDLHDNEAVGLIVINIDNFKTINNFYGFIVGDNVLEQVGKYLVEHVSKHSIYRFSGVEFALLLENNLGFYDLKEYLRTLYESLKNIVIEYQNTKIYVDITLASCSNTNHDNMFSKVSMAMKYAKERKIPFWIYEDRMEFENEYENNLNLSGIVRQAIDESKILPYFQPIFDNKTLKITKYECLARLVDKNEKIMSPYLFIPIAKKIKVYSQVTKLIINKSFEAFKDNEHEFSINLSIEDIMNGEIFNFIIEKLKNSEISNRVIFELLESEAIKDFKKVTRFVNEVKRYGAKIAIDDFGSGYSNFSYLMKMRVDYIKIDGSLIENIDIDNNAYLIVQTIVDFAKKLGVKTIAEFVHSSTVIDKVKELGIDYSQGFYIDAPSISLPK